MCAPKTRLSSSSECGLILPIHRKNRSLSLKCLEGSNALSVHNTFDLRSMAKDVSSP